MTTCRELNSPQSHLKSLLHNVFKRSDQQVADLIPAQLCQEHASLTLQHSSTEAAAEDAIPAVLDAAATTPPAAASSAAAAAQVSPRWSHHQREQQELLLLASSSSTSQHQRDSAAALDADGGLAVMTEPHPPTMHSAPCPNSSRAASCAGQKHQQQPPPLKRVLCASVDDLYQELFGDVPLPHHASAVATPTSSSAAQSPYGGSFIGVRGVSSMSPMTASSAFCQHQHAAAAAIAGTGGMPFAIDGALLAAGGGGVGVGGLAGGLMQLQGLPGSPSPPLGGSGFYAAAAAGSPCSSGFGAGGRVTYQGDCSQQPGGGGGGASNSSSSLVGGAHAQARAPPVFDDLLPPGAYPPRIRIGLNAPLARAAPAPAPAAARASASDGGCSSSSSGFSDDDDASASYCSSSAGGGCSGAGWMPALSTDGGDGGASSPSVAVSTLSHSTPQAGRGSLRYSSPQQQRSTAPGSASQHHAAAAAGAKGSVSAPGSAERGGSSGGSKLKSSLRTRWSNWISGGSSAAGDGAGSSSGSSSPQDQPLRKLKQQQQQAGQAGQEQDQEHVQGQQQDYSEQHQQQQQEDERVLSALWLTAGAGASQGSRTKQQRGVAFAAQSAPGNAAAQALYNSTGGNTTAGGGASASQQQQQPGVGQLVAHPQLMHCHSNPQLVQSAAYGSVGHGRAHFQLTVSGLGGGGAGGGGLTPGGSGVPPCARSLFGSVPQMERPLMLAGAASVGHHNSSSSCHFLHSYHHHHGGSNSSSGWLSGPGGVGFGAPAGAAAGCDDAMSVASADEEVIRQVNADNVLSTAWGPGSQHSAAGAAVASAGAGAATGSASAAAGGGGNGSGSLQQQHSASLAPKLLAFKYCCATSPLNHPGRSSPFGSARNSPFNSPRASRDAGVADLLPLRSAAAAVTTNSCPGSPLGAGRHSNPFSSSNITPPAAAAAAAASAVRCISSSDGKAAAAVLNVLKQGSSGVAQQGSLCETQSGTSNQQQQQLDSAFSAGGGGGGDPGSICSSSGGSTSKPPLRPAVRGLLRTPPPPLPLPLPSAAEAGTQELAAAATQPAADSACPPTTTDAVSEQVAEQSAGAGGGGSSSNSTGSARRVPGPVGISALMLRSGSSSSNGSSLSQAAEQSPQQQQQQQGSVSLAEGVSGPVSEPDAAGDGAAGSRSSSSSILLPLASCSIDVPSSSSCSSSSSSPKQQQQQQQLAGAPAAAAASAPDTRCSPRRQSSSRLGVSCGFTTPSRLSHNSTMGESLVAASSGGGGGFGALQRTSSCCSSSSGWVAGSAGAAAVAGGSANRGAGGRGSGSSAVQGSRDDAALLSAASVPLMQAYCRNNSSSDDRGNSNVNCSNSSDGSWAAEDPAAATTASAAADCQDCPYPSWCSSSCLSPGAPSKQQQQSLAQQPQQVGAPAEQPQHPGSGAAAAAAGSAAGAVAAVIPPSLPEVDFLEKIGRGSFGDVFKGVWCGSVVAVKVIQVKQPSALTFPAYHQHRLSSAAADALTPQQEQLDEQQPGAAAGDATDNIDSQAAQVALELAQHEYESWLNANLRHPNIVQLFTSFTIGLEEPRAASAVLSALLGSGGGCGGVGGVGGEAGGGGGGLSWKTHLVMEYCELGTMQDLLQRGVFSAGALPGHSHLCWVLATAKELCTAVSYLHSMDVVHGDLKSSNVLLKAAAATPWDSRGFVAKVSDFGLSRVMDALHAANGDPPSSAAPSAPATLDGSNNSASSNSSSAAAAAASGGANNSGSLGGLQQPCQPRFGALSHAAPELIQGQELSKASDVFSVGVLLWELLTGQAPFYGMHPGQLLSLKLSQHTSQLLHFPQATPAGLVQLCLDCWSQQASQRPSMTAVVQRINDLAVTLLGQEQAVAMFPDVAASLAAQRRAAAVAAAAAAAAASAGAAGAGC